jgi:hypothetical protein
MAIEGIEEKLSGVVENMGYVNLLYDAQGSSYKKSMQNAAHMERPGSAADIVRAGSAKRPTSRKRKRW